MVRLRSTLILAVLGLLGPTLVTEGRPPHEKSSITPYFESSQNNHRLPDASCLECHRQKGVSYMATAHQKASQPSGRESILGSFRDDGSNILMIADPAKAGQDPGLFFKMEAKDGSYYQSAVAGWPDQLRTRTERIDIVVGSGKRGQSYLYWHGDQLFQLPVSYWSEGRRWINSPGYKNGTMNFARPITPRCLECHVSFIEPSTRDPLANHYQKGSLVTGITCEQCHGPGGDHIKLRSKASQQSSAPEVEAMVNPAKLSRDRQVDICALCHGGNQMEETAPAFSFSPGESLSRFLRPGLGVGAEHPDVHGNQVGLLKKSRCYLSSPAMSCSTCHDVHAPEREASSYSSRCLSCHQVESCGMSRTMGVKITNGCVGCHMRVEPTTAFSFDTAGQPMKPTMLNHWIRIPTQNQTETYQGNADQRVSSGAP